jgi:rhamnose transport system ATP-binding protein
VLGASPRVLIFDEPTTALSESETKALLARIHQLRDEGHAVMYVTHHLEEMFEIGDRVTVLRDGGLVTTAPMSDFDHDSLIASMVGRKIESLYPASKRTIGEPRLKVRGLKPVGAAAPVDFEVRAGEIVGVAGLLGSGRSELLRAIFGADPVEGGEIEIDGERVRPGDPRRAVQAGLGLLTEDRKRLGLLLELSIRENASLAHLDEISRFWVVDRKRERNIVDQYLGGLKLRAGSWEQPVSSLSGGNQQKVLLARWLATHAKVLMFDEPTKGVDVGAKAEIYKVIGDLAAEGLGVVVVSSYLPEVLGLADRVLVMREGTVAGELPAAGATEEDVLRLASTASVEGGDGAAA